LKILINVLKPNTVLRQCPLKAHNSLAIQPYLHGCEISTFKQRDIRGLRTAGVKFMRRTAGISLLDHRRN